MLVEKLSPTFQSHYCKQTKHTCQGFFMRDQDFPLGEEIGGQAENFHLPSSVGYLSSHIPTLIIDHILGKIVSLIAFRQILS